MRVGVSIHTNMNKIYQNVHADVCLCYLYMKIFDFLQKEATCDFLFALLDNKSPSKIGSIFEEKNLLPPFKS